MRNSCPALVYNGEQKPYPGSCDIYDSFADPTFARKNMFKPFSLLDLSTKTEEELMQAKWCALPNMILKHMRARDFMNAIQSTLTPLITFLYQNNGEDVAQSI